MKKQVLLFTVLLLLAGDFSFGQTYKMGFDTGIKITSSGIFVDSGGENSNYQNLENGNTITFCPEFDNEKIKLSFDYFDTENKGTTSDTEYKGATMSDYLSYWNGRSNEGSPDGFISGKKGYFEFISSSSDGCVTFEFISNEAIESAGWRATISSMLPCTNPTAAMVDTSTLDICSPNSLNPGSLTVAFDGSNSTSSAGTTIASYEWIFGDGNTATTTIPTTTHTYANTSEIYIAYLIVRDDNTTVDPLGCASTNATQKIIRVLPDANFSNTPITYNVDCNDSLTLTGIVSSQTETQYTPTAVGGSVALPDGVGLSYTTTLDFTGVFPVGDTVTPSCYPTLTFDLEHSYSGDLQIELIAPSGQVVRVYDTHGGGTHFGSCVNALDNGQPGCPATYTVVPSGGVNWTAAVQLNAPPSSTGCVGYAGACESGNIMILHYLIIQQIHLHLSMALH